MQQAMGYGVLCCGIHQLKSAHRQADRWLIIQLTYAAEVGWTALTAGGGSGGAGVTLHISGKSVAYGGGGGGGCQTTGCIAGAGVDGGGSGGAVNATGLPGAPATGGGGGGAGGHSQNGGGANGGSGIVIIRYRLSPPA